MHAYYTPITCLFHYRFVYFLPCADTTFIMIVRHHNLSWPSPAPTPRSQVNDNADIELQTHPREPALQHSSTPDECPPRLVITRTSFRPIDAILLFFLLVALCLNMGVMGYCYQLRGSGPKGVDECALHWKLAGLRPVVVVRPIFKLSQLLLCLKN
jgi:hypothetical protein